MSLPMGEVGVGAISGGTLVALAIKLLPILLRKFNSKKSNVNNSNPGKAKVCIDRGLKIKELDMAIVGLCGSVERIEKQMETTRKENREDHQIIINRLNELQKLK